MSSLDATAPPTSGGVVAWPTLSFSPIRAAASGRRVRCRRDMAPRSSLRLRGAPADGGTLAREWTCSPATKPSQRRSAAAAWCCRRPISRPLRAAPADILTGARYRDFCRAPVGLSDRRCNFHVSPRSLIGIADQAPIQSLGPHQDVGVIPDLKFVGPDGPEPVVGPLQTVASSHSSPVESSVAAAAAGAGMTISQALPMRTARSAKP